MTIEITQSDIERGKPTAESCPIALAAERATGRPSLVYYSFYGERKKGWLLIKADETHLFRISLETQIAKWAEAYDRTGKGRPFQFDINIKGLK